MYVLYLSATLVSGKYRAGPLAVSRGLSVSLARTPALSLARSPVFVVCAIRARGHVGRRGKRIVFDSISRFVRRVDVVRHASATRGFLRPTSRSNDEKRLFISFPIAHSHASHPRVKHIRFRYVLPSYVFLQRLTLSRTGSCDISRSDSNGLKNKTRLKYKRVIIKQLAFSQEHSGNVSNVTMESAVQFNDNHLSAESGIVVFENTSLCL